MSNTGHDTWEMVGPNWDGTNLYIERDEWMINSDPDNFMKCTRTRRPRTRKCPRGHDDKVLVTALLKRIVVRSEGPGGR